MDSELTAWRQQAGRLGDVPLMAELQQLVQVDRSCEAHMLVLLAEMDARQLYLAQGYSSLFRYATSVLRMSEAQAYLRIRAARVARAYPVALEMLVEGALNLSTLKLLAPHLTVDNHRALLERARDKNKQDVELLVAQVAPQPDVPSRLRKLPAARANAVQPELLAPKNQSTATAQAPVEVIGNHTARNRCSALATMEVIGCDNAREQSTAPAQATAEVSVKHAAVGQRAQVSGAASADVVAAAAAQVEPTAAISTFALEAPRASCTALRPGRYKLEMTASQELYDHLMKLQHLLRHQVPGGDLSVIVGLAIKELSDKLSKQRFAQLSKPSGKARVKASQHEADAATAREADKVQHKSRYVPRAVVRAVFARDGAQCTFVSANGQHCAEQGMLELHHVQAFTRGGASTLKNLRVVCRSHNLYFAMQDFGAAHMRAMRAQKK